MIVDSWLPDGVEALSWNLAGVARLDSMRGPRAILDWLASSQPVRDGTQSAKFIKSHGLLHRSAKNSLRYPNVECNKVNNWKAAWLAFVTCLCSPTKQKKSLFCNGIICDYVSYQTVNAQRCVAEETLSINEGATLRNTKRDSKLKTFAARKTR